MLILCIALVEKIITNEWFKLFYLAFRLDIVLDLYEKNWLTTKIRNHLSI